MTPGTCLTAMLAALALTGCASSTGSAGRPALSDPPAVLTRDCDDPVAVSAGPGAGAGMGQTRVVELWAQDRAALVSCKARHGGLRTFYGVRDVALR